jgi:hypothetical protein
MIPKPGTGDDGFYFLDSFFFAAQVKDTPLTDPVLRYRL